VTNKAKPIRAAEILRACPACLYENVVEMRAPYKGRTTKFAGGIAITTGDQLWSCENCGTLYVALFEEIGGDIHLRMIVSVIKDEMIWVDDSE
jgi:hypothetical protein